MCNRSFKLFLGVVCFVLVRHTAQSQSLLPAPWQPGLSPVATFDLDQHQLIKFLNQTVSRWDKPELSHGISLALPQPGAPNKTYRFWESPQMAPSLAIRYPDLSTYFGQNPQDPRETVYLIRQASGFKVFYYNQAGLQYCLEPLSPHLPVYNFSDPKAAGTAAELKDACNAPLNDEDNRFQELLIGQERRGETKLYRYRLALACTGEYGIYHGGTVESVLGAMNELLLQVNAVYERELSIHFDLVEHNDLLIFLDPDADPYQTQEVEDLLETNKMVCNYALGYSNFDLGHVLTTKFGGQAHIASVCNASRKAKAFSGLQQPEGYYMSAIFAHELGHQLGAQHTQGNDCNRNLPTAYEPGSGSTLMAYAGICEPNVQDLPDNYFHGSSLELIAKKAAQGIIFGCVPGNKTENLSPSADAGPDLYVPLGTAFQLEGSGSDPNGDSLSYLWEQMDAQLATDSLLLSGPIFRSRPPETSGVRQIGGRSDPWEQLPQHPRTATFRLTVRDHHLGLGSNAYDEMQVHFVDSLERLSVVSPNTEGLQWETRSPILVQWNGAGLSGAPVHCDTVDVFLSTDGGQTYNLLLLEQVPNTGMASAVLPEITGQEFKIKVSCTGGYLFDVSEQPFGIYDPAAPASDTSVIDTTAMNPPDTAAVQTDTLPSAEPDSTVTPAPDTTANPVMDTVIISNPDTTGNTVIDTMANPVDTIPGTPMDTVPEIPGDTLTYPVSDTIDVPMDTLSEPPPDSVPDMPRDTVPDPGSDTLTTAPADTIVPPPLDTVVSQPPPQSGGAEVGNTTCPACLIPVKITPNPSYGRFFMEVGTRHPIKSRIYLINGRGQVLQERSIELDAGRRTEWDLRGYPNGMYWFRVVTKDQVWVKPVVKNGG